MSVQVGKKLMRMAWLRCLVAGICALLLFPAEAYAQRLQTQRQEAIESGMRYFELPYLIAN